MGRTIIATQYKTTKSPAGAEAKEDTTDDEEPVEQQLEENSDVSQSETLTDIENLKRTLCE